MATFPVLPGINTPLAKSEEKQIKLAQAATLKKSLLMSRQPAPEVVPTYEEQYLADLEDRRYQLQKVQAEQLEREKSALVSDEGLDTVGGQAGQLGAAMLVGGARLGAEALSAPGVVAADGALAQVPDEHRAIYAEEQQYQNRKKALSDASLQLKQALLLRQITPDEAASREAEIQAQGAALKAPAPERLAALDQVPRQAEVPLTFPGNPHVGLSDSDLQEAGALQSPKSSRQRIEEAKQALGFAKKINDSINSVTEGIMNPLNRQSLDHDLSQSWDANKASFDQAEKSWEAGDKGQAVLSAAEGVAKLVRDGGGDLIENPAAAFEYVAENLPQVAIGAFGKAGQALLAGSNLAYGGRIYREALEDYQAKHDGQLPTQDEATEMLAWSLSASAAEHVMDASILKSFKGAGGEAVKSAAEKSFLRKTAEGMTRAPLAAAKGAAGEAVTEAYQTAVEDGFSKLQDVDGEAVFKGAAVGAAAGGGLKGTAELIGQAGDVASGMREQSQEQSAKEQRSAEQQEAYQQAVETGDVSAYTNPEQPGYAPAEAVRALFEFSQKADLEPESKASAQQQASEIISGLGTQLQTLKANRTKQDPAIIQELDTGIQMLRDSLAEETDPEAKATLENLLSVQLNQRQQAETVPAEVIKRRDQQIAALEKQYTTVQKMTSALTAQRTADVKVDPVQLDQDVELLSQSADKAGPAHEEATRRVLSLAMRQPAALSTEVLDHLTSDEQNALPAPHRDYLRTLRANRVAENAFKDQDHVRLDVLEGAPDGSYIGINQYRQRMALAVEAGNTTQAGQQLAGLETFAQDRQGKVQAANEAWAEVVETGRPVQLIRDKASPTGFVRATKRLSNKALKEAVGFEVGPQSARLVAGMREEANLVKGALREMQAAYQLAFSPAPQDPEVSAATEIPAAADKDAVVEAVQQQESSAAAQAVSTPEAEPQANADEGTVPASQADSVDAELKALFAKINAEQDRAETEAPAEAPKKEGLEALKRDDTLSSKHVAQGSPKEEGRKGNPLVQIKDFLSRWQEDPFLAEDVLGGMELPEPQSNLLRQLKDHLTRWQDTLQSILVPPQAKDAGFRHLDLIQDFMDDTGAVEENLRTAIGVAAYDWLGDAAGSADVTKDDWINKAIGRDAEAEVSDDLRGLIARVGMRETFIIEALGQNVIKALSMQFKDSAPLDLQPRLTHAFGLQALRLLEKEGLLQRSEISDAELAEALEEGEGNPHLKHFFLKPVESLETDNIRRSLIGSQDLLGKLFGIEQARFEPSFEPVPFTQQTAKRAQEALPAELVANIEADMARPRFIRQDTWSVLSQLDEEAVMLMAGAQHLEDHVHAANVGSIEASNNALERDWQAAKSFIEFVQSTEQGLQQPLFMKMFVARNHRVHYDGTVLNPQSSKIHRWLVGIDGWQTIIDVNEPASFDNFRLRVLEGLGVAADKTPNQKTLADNWESTVSRPEIRQAVAALRKAITGETLVPADREAIVQGVKKGGEKLHSLDALIQLAHWSEAHRQGKSTFEVTTMGEVDGKTNGAMLAMLNYGSALFDELNRGGFFEVGSPFKTFAEWRAVQGHQDLYESLAALTQKAMAGLKPKQQGLLQAVFAITGPLTKDDMVTKEGRNITKNPLTVLFYGAGKSSVSDKMAQVFVDTIYAQIEAISRNGHTKQKVKLPQLLQGINALLASENVATLNAGMTVEQAMKVVFSAQQKAALKQAFIKLVGKPLNAAVEDKFSRHLAVKDSLVESANLMFSLFDGVYQAQRSRVIQLSGIPQDGAGQPIHDLTAAQEKALIKRLGSLVPRLPMALSAGKGTAGLLMAKQDKHRASTKDYFSDVRYFNDAGGISKKGLYGQKLQYIEPGVSPLALSTQSMDSRISSTSYRQLPSLNVHDAGGFGYGDMAQGARNLNEATFRTMMDYSAPGEMLSALEAQLIQLAKRLKDTKTAPDLKEDILRSLMQLHLSLKSNYSDEGNKGPISLQEVVERLNTTRLNAELVKYAHLAQMAVVDQYPFEGGTYEVTEADRQEAKRLGQQAADRSVTEALAAAAYLDQLLDTQAVAENQENIAKAQWRAEHLPRQGLPTARSDRGLVELLKNGSTAGDLVGYLAEHYAQGTGKDSDLKAFSAKLLKVVAKVVPADLPIHYVTAADTKLQAEASMANALAWYFNDGKGNASISVWGQDFITSQITPQVMLHELVHAALAQVVDAQATPEVRELVAELETLRGQAKAFMAGKAEFSGMAQAVENVQEFLAWGLTSPDFQLKVLTRLQLESQTTGNRLRTAWHKFVDTLAGLLLGRKKPGEQWGNGLSLFLANSHGLFSAANEAQVAGRSLTLAHAAPDEVLELTSEQILEGLPASPNRPLSAAFQAHLKGLLGGVVGQLHGPFGSVAQTARKSQAVSMTDVLFKSIDRGEMPFASETLAGPFQVSEAEAYVLEQVEATIGAVLDGREGVASIAYRQLERLFAEARSKIQVQDLFAGDWAQASADEREQAQKRWDFLFTLPGSINGKSRHLARFAAMALAHEPTQQLMKFDTSSQKEEVTGTLLEKLVHWFNNLLNTLGNQLAHTFDGQRADLKLEALVDRLVDIEAKRRRRLAAVPNRAMQMVEEMTQSVASNLREGVAKAGESALFKNSQNALVKAAGTTAVVWARDRFGDMTEVALRVRNQQLQKPLGVAAHLLNDFRGAMPNTQEFFRLLRERKQLEKERQEKISHTRELVLKQFRDSGAALTLDQKKALSQLLRLDLASLLNGYSESQIGQFLGDPQALAQAIASEKQQLMASTYRHAYDKAAKNLGYFMVSNQARGEHQMLNAGNIVRRFGTGSQISEQEVIDQFTPVVDRLATLYALQYSSVSTLASAREIWRSEQQNPAGNGVVATLKLYQSLIESSRQTLFQGSEALMIKGYLPEITDPHREVLAALPDEEEQLQRMGYSAGEQLKVDALDPNPQQRRLYVHTNKGLRPYLSSVMGYTAKKAKGSQRKRYGAEVDATVLQADHVELVRMRRAKEALAVQDNQPDPHYDPRKVTDKGVKLVPVVNPDGVVVNYRYMMSAENRDTLLDRDNRFENLMGQLAGNTFDKLTNTSHNRTVVEALYEHFRNEYADKPDSFAVIGPQSQDRQLREIWRMLPDETKHAVSEVWGQNYLQVPYEMLDLIFGYRKPSIAHSFEKEADEWGVMEQLVVPMLEAIYPDIGNRLRQAEDVWKEAVGLVKNIWVIRSLVTIMGNIKSNLTLLFAYGVSPVEMARSHVIAFKGAWAYRQDYKAREQLKLLLDSGMVMGSTQEMEQEIRRLEDRLARNPVKELIEGGLLPSIVEDVADVDDPYSYQSKLEQKVGKVVDALPPPLVTAGKWLVMAKGTGIYDMFNQTVQLSDFMGRYTLYQHLITRKNNPMSKIDAMDKATEAFIQYDIPMHRFMTYLDEMGIVPFMRFHIRIQKIIFQLFREKPARMLSMVLLGNFFNTSSLITDASMLEKLGNNPLSVGALNLPGAIEDIATMKAALDLLPSK